MILRVAPAYASLVPTMPAGALELDVPESQYLEMSAKPA
jgi:hypothetical protein